MAHFGRELVAHFGRDLTVGPVAPPTPCEGRAMLAAAAAVAAPEHGLQLACRGAGGRCGSSNRQPRRPKTLVDAAYRASGRFAGLGRCAIMALVKRNAQKGRQNGLEEPILGL